MDRMSTPMRNDGKIARGMKRAKEPARLVLLSLVALCAIGVPKAEAQEYDLKVGFGWQLFVPVLGPARDLDPGFAPRVSVSLAPESSRLAFLGRGGFWYVADGAEEETVATLVPFLMGGEYTLRRWGRISTVGQLLGGAVWLEVRNLEEDDGPPFEESWSTSRYLRVAGSAALLLRVELTEKMSFESGVTLDVIAFEESQYPGFVAFPLSIAAHF